MTPAGTHAILLFLTALASAAARSIALAAVVAAALAVSRTKSVRVRLFAWKGVLLAVLAMPVLMAITPALRVAVPLPSLPDRSGAALAAPAPAPPVASDYAEPLAASQTVSDDGVEIAQRVDEPAEAHTPAVSQDSRAVLSSSAPAPTTVRGEIPWLLILFAVYAAMAPALLVRVALGIRLSNRLVRIAKPIDDPQAVEPLVLASEAAGLRAVPWIGESEAVSVPVAVGVRKPAILLAAGWRDWDTDELAAVIAHEVSHVARRDALMLRLALIHRAIFWFSPLAWWLERHLADLAEQASDEAALAGGMDRTRYAEALLGFFAVLEAGEKRVWWQGVSMAKAGQAEKRVDRILAWRGAMSNRWKKSLVIAFVVVGVPLVALTAAVRLSAYAIQEPPTPAAPPAPAAARAQASDAALPATPAAPAAPAAAQSDAESDGAPPAPIVRSIHVEVPPIPPFPPMQLDVPAINLDVPPVHVDMPPVRVDVPPVHVQTPHIQIETNMLRLQDAGPTTFSNSGDWNFHDDWSGGYFVGRYSDWGPRFAVVTHDSDDLTMSGDRNDAEHARELKKKIPGDFIWFERDGKSFVINDSAVVNRAKQLWQPAEDLQKQQKDLGKQMQDLSKQQEDSRQKMEDTKIKLPDMTAEVQKLEESMKQLSANGGTMNEIGELQRQIGDLQREIGQAESSAAHEAGTWGREQGEWGRKMGDIGRQMGDIGRKQAQLSRDAARQMRELLDDAVSKGLAKPE